MNNETENAHKEMQKIVEAVGECWHDEEMICGNCGALGEENPYHGSLNDLFGLADKLGFDSFSINNCLPGVSTIFIEDVEDSTTLMHGRGYTLADALRASLVKAIEGRE